MIDPNNDICLPTAYVVKHFNSLVKGHMVLLRYLVSILSFIGLAESSIAQTESLVKYKLSADSTLRLGLPPPPVAPNAETNPLPKARYISFEPTNPNRLTALRVRLTSLHHPNPAPPGTPDFSQHEGQLLWVGPPSDYPENWDLIQFFRAAKLQCQPHFMDWSTVGLLHVYGGQIVPNSVYDVQAVMDKCDPSAPECGSPFLSVMTGRQGDVTPPFEVENIRPQPDVLDVGTVINKIKNLPGAPSKVFLQAHPQVVDPSNLINIIDAGKVIDSIKWIPYLYDMPPPCP